VDLNETTILSPMQAFTTAQAYVILADNKTMPEERAELVTLLGKHVSKHEMSPSQIQRLTADAFAYVAANDFEKFLVSIEASLTPGQIICIFCNMYETMIIDGLMIAKEKELIEQFYRFFQMDRRVVNTVREILFLKNDTSMFLKADHPNNSRDFKLSFLDRMDAET
jgi:uncharacterized tellurite resistance protein B-like protein